MENRIESRENRGLRPSKLVNVVFAEGEDDRVLDSIGRLVNSLGMKPQLVGRREVIVTRVNEIEPALICGVDFDITHHETTDRHLSAKHRQRRWVEQQKPTVASQALQSLHSTQVAAALVKANHYDGVICGLSGSFAEHLAILDSTIDSVPTNKTRLAMTALRTAERIIFFCNTHGSVELDDKLVIPAILVAEKAVRSFGFDPKTAIVTSPADIGDIRFSPGSESDENRYQELKISENLPGCKSKVLPMQEIIKTLICGTKYDERDAALLVFPNTLTGNIFYHFARVMTSCTSVGPFLLGGGRNASILTPAATVEGLIDTLELLYTARCETLAES